jgi:hypothetical protein
MAIVFSNMYSGRTSVFNDVAAFFHSFSYLCIDTSSSSLTTFSYPLFPYFLGSGLQCLFFSFLNGSVTVTVSVWSQAGL